MNCPNCESTLLSWGLSTRLASYVTDPLRLTGHDVIPQLVFSCDECSETIRVIEDGPEFAQLRIVAP